MAVSECSAGNWLSLVILKHTKIQYPSNQIIVVKEYPGAIVDRMSSLSYGLCNVWIL